MADLSDIGHIKPFDRKLGDIAFRSSQTPSRELAVNHIGQGAPSGIERPFLRLHQIKRLAQLPAANQNAQNEGYGHQSLEH